MLIELELVVDDHHETNEEVGGSDSSESDQSLLTDGDPWGVAHAQEDGLKLVSDAQMKIGCEGLRGHRSASCDPWEGEQ
jgi:hypothetical protein